MSKKTEYILTGKQRISSTGSDTIEKGEIITATQLKKLSKRQQGFFEGFDEKNPKHRKLTDRLYDTELAEKQARDTAKAEKKSGNDEEPEENEDENPVIGDPDPAELKADKEDQKKSDSESAGEKSEKKS